MEIHLDWIDLWFIWCGWSHNISKEANAIWWRLTRRWVRRTTTFDDNFRRKLAHVWERNRIRDVRDRSWQTPRNRVISTNSIKRAAFSRFRPDFGMCHNPMKFPSLTSSRSFEHMKKVLIGFFMAIVIPSFVVLTVGPFLSAHTITTTKTHKRWLQRASGNIPSWSSTGFLISISNVKCPIFPWYPARFFPGIQPVIPFIPSHCFRRKTIANKYK